MLYMEWLSEWLENYVKTSVKERTYAKYADIVRIRLIPELGDYELDELTPLIMQRYITELLHHGNLNTGGGLSANTVNLIIAVLQSSMVTAYSVGLTNEYKMNKTPEDAGKTNRLLFSLGAKNNRASSSHGQTRQNDRRSDMPIHRLTRGRVACP